MLRNTIFAAIAVAASIIMIGSQADAQTFGRYNSDRAQERPRTETFSRNSGSAKRGFTITNAATAAAEKKKRQNNVRYGNSRDRQRINQLFSRSQLDQSNGFGVGGRNSVLVNPPVNPRPQELVCVPQVPTPAPPRPLPRLVPNEFIDPSTSSSFATVSAETETEDTKGQPIENPFFSVLVTDE